MTTNNRDMSGDESDARQGEAVQHSKTEAAKVLGLIVGGGLLAISVMVIPLFAGVELAREFDLATDVTLFVGVAIGLGYWGVHDILSGTDDDASRSTDELESAIIHAATELEHLENDLDFHGNEEMRERVTSIRTGLIDRTLEWQVDQVSSDAE